MQANDIETCWLPLRMPSATISAPFDVPLQFLVLRRTGAKPKVRLNLRAADPAFLSQRHRPPYQFIITSSVLRYISILLQLAVPIYTTMSRLRSGGLEVSVEIGRDQREK
jgi:hypothetical protein